MASGRFGRLWSLGHETFAPSVRRILSVKGKGATSYLQGLVTCDLTKDPPPPLEEEQFGEKQAVEEAGERLITSKLLRATCFLDVKGRTVSDALLWKQPTENDSYLIDVPSDTANNLLAHLNRYKIGRSTKKVVIEDKSCDMSAHCIYGTMNSNGCPPGFLAAVDPRHPSLGLRLVSTQPPDTTTTTTTTSSDAATTSHEARKQHFESMVDGPQFPRCNNTYRFLRQLNGIAEGNEVSGRTPLTVNQDLISGDAISFHKGCYLGQELTARTMHTGVVRKRVLPIIFMDTKTQIPLPWMEPTTLMGNRNMPLPRLAVTPAAGVMALLQGEIKKKSQEDQSQQDQSQQEPPLDIHPTMQEVIHELEEHATLGAKIVDKSDGKTIGEVISTPTPGTSLLLAQVRLDKLHLFGVKPRDPDHDSTEDDTDDTHHHNNPWKFTNKVVIGSGKKELRYLPYLPLWWPPMDTMTGKRLRDD